MATQQKLIPQNPLILRCHRIMEAFAKSDDERDFYLDRQEGFLIFVDLDKTQEELDDLIKELKTSAARYCQIPKLTFYEIKKVMEGFVNEKVYDIDTKEKLLDIIQSKEARENFLEFIYDHHTELEKWQQYYQERFRVRIIEWLRNNQFDFVFEEDLDITKSVVEKLKLNLFGTKVSKDLVAHRKNLSLKAKTYYSNEALNPRPKRGRPPKQVAKIETEPQFSQDIYITIPKQIKTFVFSPDYHGASAIFTFSGKFASEAELLAHRKQQLAGSVNMDLQNLQQKLAALRSLSASWQSVPQLTLTPTAEKPLNGSSPEVVRVTSARTAASSLEKKKKSALRPPPPPPPPPTKKAKVVPKASIKAPANKAPANKAPANKAPTKAFVKAPPKAPVKAFAKAPAKVPPKAFAKAPAKVPPKAFAKAPPKTATKIVPKKTAQKVRLRPLAKKAVTPAPAKKISKGGTVVAKGKAPALRKLRRAKRK